MRSKHAPPALVLHEVDVIRATPARPALRPGPLHLFARGPLLPSAISIAISIAISMAIVVAGLVLVLVVGAVLVPAGRARLEGQHLGRVAGAPPQRGPRAPRADLRPGVLCRQPLLLRALLLGAGNGLYAPYWGRVRGYTRPIGGG